MSITPDQFIKKYADTKLNERGGAQLHFIDLCDLLAIPRPDGSETYRFEQPVLKVAGGKGFADVFYEHKFGWEYKGKGADLKKAYQQLLSYREDLDNPPLLIVSDMQNIELHTNFTATQKKVIKWTLDDLREGQRRDELRRVWSDPNSFNPSHQIEEATVAAVAAMGKISNALKDRQENPEMVAHFLVRTMFTLFAEDVELIPEGTFKRLLEAAKKHPEDFQEMCQELFAAMKVGKKTVVGRIPYINGGVFDDTSAPMLTGEEVNRLHDASKRDWKQVDPTIFGTLFETVIDPSKRWQLGAHYTPLVDILDVVEPVIMRPLRGEWEALRQSLGPLLAEIEQARAQHSGGLYAEGGLGQSQQDEAASRLTAFQDRLTAVKVLDPAMGSGNFLYVTMRLLLDLEAEVRETIRTVTHNVPPAPKVSPRQMLGMEVNPYAHEIAGMVLWIGYLQWMREHHETVRVSPVLDKLPGLVQQDAVYDEENQAVREWPEAEFIVGNPPFLGYSPMREQLGTAYVEGLRAAYRDRIPGFSDFVCFFFEKARENIEQRKTKRAGLIATNSIAGGENARVLDRILHTGGIFRAWPDRAWTQSGAAVRTSVVMFDDGSDPERLILKHSGDERDPKKRQTVEKAVPTINADLSSGPDVRSAVQLKENAGRAFIGVVPGAKGFVISSKTAQEWLSLPNSEGVNNADVVRPFKVGKDINDMDSGRYIIDFSIMSLEEAQKYEEPMAQVVAAVKPEKEKMTVKTRRENWWRFNTTAPQMAKALMGLQRFIATSIVSEHRFFVLLENNAVTGNKLAVIASESYVDFGILNSTLHTLWAERKGSTHGVANDLSYTPSTTFETFPFPRPTPEQHAAIEKAAKHLEAVRSHLKQQENPKKKVAQGKLTANQTVTSQKITLTGMYNLLTEYRETGIELVTGIKSLDRAHRTLDEAVAAAYGWTWPMEEDELLGKLLELNLERARGENAVSKKGDKIEAD